ncbi:Hypothetical predicted protein [Olea europaea subsp. europaea]|uniref:Uncharacterized protein n=1 Tax=Olea europaea subsp. europaea TaxID=158383 RepID=A0A8S0U0F2_OLEEU|nr:Hypothetical predicted protein [Olea europaea subsp. europaea]
MDLGMTETRSKMNEEHLKRLDKEIADLGVVFKTNDQLLQALCTRQDRMEQMMGEMKANPESMVLMLAQLAGNRADYKEKQVEGYGLSSLASGDNLKGNETKSGNFNRNKEMRMATKLPKIDFPYFSGEGPREWLRKANKYFQIH